VVHYFTKKKASEKNKRTFFVKVGFLKAKKNIDAFLFFKIV